MGFRRNIPLTNEFLRSRSAEHRDLAPFSCKETQARSKAFQVTEAHGR